MRIEKGNGAGAIGVFDSGVGGLTVFREIARALPRESLIYLGDSARVPYGTKSPQTVLRYSHEAARHLMGRGIKMLVVACNTATAAALPEVIATEGTVRSRAYTIAIKKLDPDVEVIESAAPLFVPLAEEGWANTHVAREVAEIYLEPLIDAGIDTLVLGCTHYPILRGTIEQVVGGAVHIVDSAETTASTVKLALGNSTGVSNAARQFLVTDAEERFRRIAGEFLEQEIEHLELVSLG